MRSRVRQDGCDEGVVRIDVEGTSRRRPRATFGSICTCRGRRRGRRSRRRYTVSRARGRRPRSAVVCSSPCISVRVGRGLKSRRYQTDAQHLTRCDYGRWSRRHRFIPCSALCFREGHRRLRRVRAALVHQRPVDSTVAIGYGCGVWREAQRRSDFSGGRRCEVRRVLLPRRQRP